MASPSSFEETYLHPTQGELRYILTVLAATEEKLAIPWKEIASVLGVSRADNAQSRFRDIGRRLGWRSYGGPGPASVNTDISPRKPSSRSIPVTPSKPKGSPVKSETKGSAMKNRSPIKKDETPRKSGRAPQMTEKGKKALETLIIDLDSDDGGTMDDVGSDATTARGDSEEYDMMAWKQEMDDEA